MAENYIAKILCFLNKSFLHIAKQKEPNIMFINYNSKSEAIYFKKILIFKHVKKTREERINILRALVLVT